MDGMDGIAENLHLWLLGLGSLLGGWLANRFMPWAKRQLLRGVRDDARRFLELPPAQQETPPHQDQAEGGVSDGLSDAENVSSAAEELGEAVMGSPQPRLAAAAILGRYSVPEQIEILVAAFIDERDARRRRILALSRRCDNLAHELKNVFAVADSAGTRADEVYSIVVNQLQPLLADLEDQIRDSERTRRLRQVLTRRPAGRRVSERSDEG